MDLTTIKDILGKAGEWISINVTQKLIHWLSSKGVSLGVAGSKIFSIIILLSIAGITITLLSKLRGIIKWSIILLSILLAISVGISFF